jgi:hypothetical protein
MSGCRAHETYAEKMDLLVSPLELSSSEDLTMRIITMRITRIGFRCLTRARPQANWPETISRIQQRVQKIRNSSQAGYSARKR